MDQTDVCDRKEMESKGLKEAFSCALLRGIDKHHSRRYGRAVESSHMALTELDPARSSLSFKVYSFLKLPGFSSLFIGDVYHTLARWVSASKYGGKTGDPKNRRYQPSNHSLIPAFLRTSRTAGSHSPSIRIPKLSLSP